MHNSRGWQQSFDINRSDREEKTLMDVTVSEIAVEVSTFCVEYQYHRPQTGYQRSERIWAFWCRESRKLVARRYLI